MHARLHFNSIILLVRLVFCELIIVRTEVVDQCVSNNYFIWYYFTEIFRPCGQPASTMNTLRRGAQDHIFCFANRSRLITKLIPIRCQTNCVINCKLYHQRACVVKRNSKYSNSYSLKYKSHHDGVKINAAYCSSVSTHTKSEFQCEDPIVLNLYHGLLAGQRASLAQSITLVESKLAERKAQAKLLLSGILNHLRREEKKNKGVSPTFRIGK